jgi:uncharacterized membrane protein
LIDALPNLHAAVLHFPIVLLPLAWLSDALALTRPKVVELDRLAATLWLLAAVTTAAAFLAGRSAADGLMDVPPSGQLALSQHADVAWVLLLGVLSVATLRLCSLLAKGRVHLGGRIVTVLLGTLLLFQLLSTADRGGALVYRHALAVQLPDSPVCPTCEAGPVEGNVASRWRIESDGTGVWEPRSGDLRDGGPVLVIGDAQEVEGEDLSVQAEGQTLLLLPGTWGDVHVNASVQLSEFQGTVGVVHHLSDATTFGAFTVTTAGRSRLTMVQGASLSVLHEATWSPASDAVLSISAAGSHLKGLVGGQTVNHGHAPSPADGRVGLLVDGTGIVGVRRVEVIPLANH